MNQRNNITIIYIGNSCLQPDIILVITCKNYKLTEDALFGIQELQDGVARAKGRNEEMIKIRKEIVDFHGEMVLLENYSSLNYTGKFLYPFSL